MRKATRDSVRQQDAGNSKYSTAASDSIGRQVSTTTQHPMVEWKMTLPPYSRHELPPAMLALQFHQGVQYRFQTLHLCDVSAYGPRNRRLNRFRRIRGYLS